MGRFLLILLLAVVTAVARGASPTAAQPVAAEPDRESPLSAAESRVQGRWQGYDSTRGFKTWSLDVRGRKFRAEGSVDWYEGRLVLRGDRKPGWIDFVIERCDCSYEGATSEAVFGWQGESLLIAAPSPGNPRPARLEGTGSQLMRFEPR